MLKNQSDIRSSQCSGSKHILPSLKTVELGTGPVSRANPSRQTQCQDKGKKVISQMQNTQGYNYNPRHAAQNFTETLHPQIYASSEISGNRTPDKPKSKAENRRTHTQDQRCPKSCKGTLEQVESCGIRTE